MSTSGKKARRRYRATHLVKRPFSGRTAETRHRPGKVRGAFGSTGPVPSNRRRFTKGRQAEIDRLPYVTLEGDDD